VKAAPSVNPAFSRGSLLAVVTLAWLFFATAAQAQETAPVRLADGFSLPVGLEGTKTYHKARGFHPDAHLGEDWNGAGGGDSDLGDPVYSIAHGLVVFARDYQLGWGNVVIVRHAYLENGVQQYVDSLYGHLHEMFVREGQHVTRAQKIGTIGNNRGMYNAHLHFELRKNLQIGMLRHRFARDFSNYWDPESFIKARSTLPGGVQIVSLPVNTFAKGAAPVYAGPVTRPPEPALAKPGPKPIAAAQRAAFVVDRFEDLRAWRE
jgi:hypothetical protein